MENSLFVYETFRVSDDRKTVDLKYTSNVGLQVYEFTETYVFPVSLPDTLETYRLLRALHIIGGISYYKTFVNTDIEHPYAMSTKEAAFWNTVYKNGLGEFLLVNKLESSRLAEFTPQEGQDTKTTVHAPLTEKALLGIGGGKDSIVAGELLKAINMPLTGFVLTTADAAGQTKAVAKTMKIDLTTVERHIDKSLLEVQETEGAYKGHVPISVFFALVGSLMAVALKHKYVIVANEASASIPRAHWEGNSINHQWSKSFEFEKMMQDYIHSYVSADMWYFSAIRPLTSVAVAKIFASHPQYFEHFTSDNYAFRISKNDRPPERWSLQSPKSLSSFILLSAWLSEEDLLRIFGKNFLGEPSLEEMFFSLTGISGDQPLDCVGTPEELRASLGEAYRKGIFTDAILMLTGLHYDIIAKDRVLEPSAQKFLKLSNEHSFPPNISDALMSKITEVIV